jgi:cytochrome c oxidase cbb3-type subunit 4
MFTDASSAMTLISFLTFIGILWWTFGIKRSGDFDAAAHLPFADDDQGADAIAQDTEKHHG